MYDTRMRLADEYAGLLAYVNDTKESHGQAALIAIVRNQQQTINVLKGRKSVAVEGTAGADVTELPPDVEV
jgi:hypothetical protein